MDLSDIAPRRLPMLRWEWKDGETKALIYHGDMLDVLSTMADESVDCVVTSPPYWDDYGVPEQIGLESTLTEYIDMMVRAFREVRRVLRRDGTLWLVLGDCYNRTGRKPGKPSSYNLKARDLIGIPWRVAIALQFDGWWLRTDLIWSRPNQRDAMPDRPSRAHEYVFLLTKEEQYFYDETAACNQSSVWEIARPEHRKTLHAPFPEKLVESCVLAGCPAKGIVLDPFMGSGTTLVVALRLGRSAIGIDIGELYCDIASKRISEQEGLQPKKEENVQLARLLRAAESLPSSASRELQSLPQPDKNRPTRLPDTAS